MNNLHLHILLVLLMLSVSGTAARTEEGAKTKPSSSTGKQDAWDRLPKEMTLRIHPVGEVKVRSGATKDGKDYIKIHPAKKGKVSFQVRPLGARRTAYSTESKNAIYWPELHLLNLEGDLIVSASSCRLEGRSFDILLPHNTVRLMDPKVISLPNGLAPIESGAVRITGLGEQPAPFFQWDGEAASEPTPEPEATPEPVMSHTIQVSADGKIAFEGTPCELDEFRNKVRALAAESPGASFALHQPQGVNASVVKKVRQVLEESGFDKVKTVVDRPEMNTRTLEAEVSEVVNEDGEMTVPPQQGGRLLWMYGPGKYYLNGKPFNEGSLRQTLRGLVKSSADVPIVVAGPRGAPDNALKELATEVKGYGFHDVQLGMRAKGE
jgi:biopolymer transport protein ExbD